MEHFSEALKAVSSALESVLGAPVTAAAGWPVIPRADTAAQSAQGVALELSFALSPRERDACLWLDQGLARALVEQLLGAPSTGRAAHASLALSPTEQGVLAFIAAKALAQTRHGRLLTLENRDEFQARSCDLLVSVAIELGGSAGVGHLVAYAGAEKGLGDACCNLQLKVSDEAPEEAVLALRPGDLLLSERLRASGDQLIGLRATLDGCVEEATAALRPGDRAARAGTVRPALPLGGTEIVLTEQTVTLRDAAQFRGGAPIHVSPQPVRVRHAGREVAQGELVFFRGAPAIRVVLVA